MDCSSAEKKDLTTGNNYIASKKIEVVTNFYEGKKSDRKRISNLKKPADFKPVKARNYYLR